MRTLSKKALAQRELHSQYHINECAEYTTLTLNADTQPDRAAAKRLADRHDTAVALVLDGHDCCISCCPHHKLVIKEAV